MEGMTLERMQVIIEAQTKSYKEALKQVTRQTQAMTKDVTVQTSKIKSAFGSLGKGIIGLGIGAAIYKVGKDAIGFASDLTEVQNVVDTSFGKMAYKMEAFAKTSIDQFGLSELTAKKTASIFAAMGKGIGVPAEMATDMALSLTALSADMSSFFNTSQSEADTALKAIYTGETESIKRYGIAMTEINMQEYARQQGINKSIEAMTQNEKVMLRYQYVTNQLAMVNGDFAKTSDTWANQTRVLSERFKQLMGILGNGLMQVLLPVLQVINKVMASLVSFAQMFSKVIGSLFGKNTNKQSSVAQAQEQANYAIGGATDLQGDYNDELDKTTGKAKKAAKEIANVFSFDQITKLNTSTSSDTDSGTGASGAGFGDIGPIDLGFDQEQDISGIETTVEKVKALLESIFDPIIKSWEKYGVPIIAAFERGFNNLIYIGKDIFRVIGEHWKTTLQPISDFVFSVAETCALAFEGVTIVLKSAWDNGGSYLLGKIMDFVGAIANLATKINDTFVKPIIRWFNDNLAPVVGSVIGFVLAKIGDVLSTLTNVLDFIASNKAILVVFTTAVTTMIGAWTTAKLVNWVNSFGSLMGLLAKGKDKILDLVSNGITKLYVSYDDANKALKIFCGGIKDSWNTLKTTVTRIMENVVAWKTEKTAKEASKRVDIIQTFKNIGTAIGNAAKKIIDWVKQLLFGKAAQQAVDTANKVQTSSTLGLAAAEGVATGATGALSKAMAFLAANPIIAVIGAIALVVGSLAIWASSQSDTSDEIEETTEKAQQQSEAIGELQKSMADSLANSTVDINNVRAYVEELKGLVDTEGNVIGNKDRVLFLMSEINKVMPDSVYWTDQGTVAYKDGADALSRNIALKEAQLKLEAIEPAYKEAIMKKQSALNDMVRANGDYMKANTELKALESKALQTHSQEDINNYSLQLGKVKELDNLRRTTTENYENYSNITSQYSNLTTAIQTGDMSKVATASNALTVEFDKDGKAIASSQATMVRDMQTTYNDMLAQKQIDNNAYTDEELRLQKVELDAKKGALYEGYFADCENKNEVLTLLKEHNGLITEEQAQQFANQLREQEAAGGNEARAYLDNLKRDLKNGNLTNEGWGLFSKIKNVFDNNPIQVKTELSVIGGLRNFANNVKSSLDQALSRSNRMATGIMPSGMQPISPMNLNLPMMAKGGLTNRAMAAVIGEAGTEAVIPLENNTRAIDLITSKFLAGVPQQSGDMHITITLDSGEVLTRHVIKNYNKLMTSTGGQGGFIL